MERDIRAISEAKTFWKPDSEKMGGSRNPERKPKAYRHWLWMIFYQRDSYSYKTGWCLLLLL